MKRRAKRKSALRSTIHILSKQKKYPVDTDHIRNLVEAFFHFHKLPHNEVSIHFVTKSEIAKLHDIYFDDPSITDCISFPMDSAEDPGYKVLGEVFVCPAVAYEYARDHDTSYPEEVDLYVTHGLLHLIGFDDINPADIKCMRLEEKRFLQYFA